MDTLMSAFLNAMGWEVRTGYSLASEGQDTLPYTFVVCSKHTKHIHGVHITNGRIEVDTRDTFGVHSLLQDRMLTNTFFHGWGSNEEEALLKAASNLKDIKEFVSDFIFLINHANVEVRSGFPIEEVDGKKVTDITHIVCYERMEPIKLVGVKGEELYVELEDGEVERFDDNGSYCIGKGNSLYEALVDACWHLDVDAHMF